MEKCTFPVEAVEYILLNSDRTGHELGGDGKSPDVFDPDSADVYKFNAIEESKP